MGWVGAAGPKRPIACGLGVGVYSNCASGVHARTHNVVQLEAEHTETNPG